MSILSLIQAAQDRNHGTCLVAELPANLSARFPDAAQHNHGHKPHTTVCYVTSQDLAPGAQSEIYQVLRGAVRKCGRMTLVADLSRGLQSFGDTDSGEKALWFPVRSEPAPDALGYLHRVCQVALEVNRLPYEGHPSFMGHMTWSYVPNTITAPEIDRMSAVAAALFPQGLRYEVTCLTLGQSDGTTKLLPLNMTL
jgi:hypothetical protein